jgi:hypothetical protein
MDNDFDKLSFLLNETSWKLARRRAPGPLARSPAFVGRVFANPSVPTSTGRFFAVHSVAVLGAEGEGQPGSLSDDAGTTANVFVVGSRVPAAGDDLVCRLVGDRWVAESAPALGAAGITLPGCSCTVIPLMLRMTSLNPSCNGGMFQPCTLAYGATPTQYGALALGAECFLSTASFVDENGDSFRYYFACERTQFTLSRVYANSLFGSPFLDPVRYTWPLGAPGNTCDPFLLAGGQIYPGGDPSCSVTISA